MIDFASSIGGNPALLCGDKVFPYESFKSLAMKNAKQLDALWGRDVLLDSLDSFSLCKLIPLMEGIAKRVLIIPSTFDEQTKFQLLEALDNPIAVEMCEADNLHISLKHHNESCPHRGPQHITTEWLIPSSGTTGIPKVTSHTMASLTRTTKKGSSISHSFTWGLSYEVSRFAGLQVFLQSFWAGASIAIPQVINDTQSALKYFSDKKVNALSGTPSFWRKCLMTEEIRELSLSNITLGGEAVSQDVLDGLMSIFPEAYIIHIYASTEAGVGFSVKDKKAGFPLEYLDKNHKGTQIKVNSHGELLLKSEIPSIQLDKRVEIDDEGFIKSGDLVSIIGGRVIFIGRVSGAINIGGNKVHPEEVERVLNASKYVVLSMAFAKKNPILGNLVEAKITLNLDEAKTMHYRDIIKILKSDCKAALDSYKVPVKIQVVDEIETNATGKVVRFLSE